MPPTKGKYECTVTEAETIRKAFSYHSPKGDQLPRYLDLRERAKELAFAVMRECPPSRERSLAIKRLQEAIMWANAAIARNE